MKTAPILDDAIGSTEVLAAHRVLAWHAASMSVAELAALRKQPGTLLPASITPQFVKHGDDQAVASLAAVYGAVERADLKDGDFGDWGVVAANRFVGRAMVAKTLTRYAVDGPWGVSMQIIPHHMLHSVASTLGLALGCRGICLGAGGGPGGELDAIFVAVNLLRDPNTPAVWVVIGGWSPELVVDRSGVPASNSRCTVVALALAQEPARAGESNLSLRRIPTSSSPASRTTASADMLGLFEQPRNSLSMVLQCSADLQIDLDLRSSPKHSHTQIRIDAAERLSQQSERQPLGAPSSITSSLDG